jgi:hypothetical protein
MDNRDETKCHLSKPMAKKELTENQEFTTMPMHPIGWWANNKNKQIVSSVWGADGTSSQLKRIPASFSDSTITDNTSVNSYDITKTNHIFTACHNDEPKPSDNVWIGISH